MLLAAMDAWGIGIASAKDNPPVLDRNAAGTKVIIIGAGLAGMTAAFVLAMLVMIPVAIALRHLIEKSLEE